MKIQVFKQREDETIDFTDSIVVDENNIPEGYVQIPKEEQGMYNEEGRKLTVEELEAIRNAPKEPTEVEVLQKQLADLQFSLIMNGVV